MPVLRFYSLCDHNLKRNAKKSKCKVDLYFTMLLNLVLYNLDIYS